MMMIFFLIMVVLVKGRNCPGGASLRKFSQNIFLKHGGEDQHLDCFTVAEELAERFAAEDAVELVNAVAQASVPLIDFGERLGSAVKAVLTLYEQITVNEEDTSKRSDARHQLVHDLANALSAAHADHLVTLRQAAVDDLTNKLQALDLHEKVDDAERIRAWATVATDVEIAFRTKIDEATPPQFLPLFSASLEDALETLRDDFRNIFEEFELSRPLDLDDLDDDIEDKASDDNNEHPVRSAAKLLASSPRFLRAAGFILNVLQARAAIRAAKNAANMRDETIPKLPLF
eukprot:CAMPEP_0197287640 /NCGR_PEP_ID=MMETSP0890-20130614/4245_1 /TAXON_ID=44058 ORGANISM="Aureoumbra lagunensis, Strain CCMP1510" /NCGR_SAMPLE_ID=MMETSP0890 /ASSEMBLY_ACC=CAM_ASM_000533 /LENGTH=288 /DNA_ID=CAMNT_0042757579 /DNA_START=341 /DNA_END=1207 /DNA_ORIENTATION=+